MKYVLLCVLTLQLVMGGVAFAQTDDTKTSDKALLAGVSLTDASLVQDGRSVTVTFTLTNQTGVQPGVKYAIILARETETLQTMEDIQVQNEELTLVGGESVTRSVVYTAPAAFEGMYTIYVQSANQTGFPYGMVRAGTLTLPSAASKLSLESGSCYVTSGGAKKYTPYEVVTLQNNQILTSHCVLKNTTAETLTLTPRFTTNEGSLYGPLTAGEGGSLQTVTLLPNEEKTIVTELPRAQRAGLHVVTIAFDSEGNSESYRYQTTGAGLFVGNVILDAPTYKVGDTANIRLIVGGKAAKEHRYLVDVRDGNDAVCAETFTGVAQNTALYTNIDVPVVITAPCKNPQVVVQLVDEAGIVAHTSSHSVMLRPELSSETTTVPRETDGAPRLPLSIWFSIIGLAVGLGYFYHSLSKKGNPNVPPGASLLILLTFLSVGFMFTPQAEAASFTQGGCSVSISYDPVTTIKTGDTLTVSGYTSCPGLQVDAMFLAAGYGFSVTANAFGGFFGSFNAPPNDDVIQYISGDWTMGPFGNPMPPWDLIFVNYCPPGYLEYCQLPPYDSIFGEKVGWSGGACGAGSTGNCNYTCQPDLTWKKNSNTCSAPPPPPPGSTPQFTSTPSCVIDPNASSCATTVGVSVPATYTWGADLKLCDGTYLQTIPPGNQNISVTIPYNSRCFNLHPWSFIVTQPTDTVTGTSACAPGSTWNNSVCAPVPPTPPAVPTGLSAQAGASCGTKSINVSWNPVTNATSYDLLRDGTTLLSGVTSTFVDTVALDGSPHTYQVRAWAGSLVSAWSTPLVQGIASAICPVASGSLTVNTCSISAGQSTCSVNVAWISSNATAPNVTQNGALFSTAISSPPPGTPRTVGYGSTAFTLRDSTTNLDTKTVIASCLNGLSWNNSTCESSITPPPPSLPCAGGEYNGCVVQNTSSGGSSGVCNATTHTGTCSIQCDPNGTGSWVLPGTNNCSLISTPPPVVTGPPTLTASSRLVNQDSPITLTWDTNNGDEGLCTLTGGTLSGFITRNATDPNAEQGSVSQIIRGRTTYTLWCPSGQATILIDVIPKSSET